jgi:RNA polymerase sigma-70 factor (ECF subfamily)
LSNGQIQGITIAPGQWVPAGRAHAPSAKVSQAKVVQAKVGQAAMPVNTLDDEVRAQRFREAALPHLDDVYTLARYLLRNAADAEDAVQECYLRALKHFDSYRGPAMKPWLFAILRNVCRAEYARRASAPSTGTDDTPETAEQAPLWHEEQQTPEAELLRERDASAIRRMVDTLAEPFKETFVLREINDLSYREIAEAVGAPVGTVMSRLARARAMLRSAWLAEQEHAK